MLSVGLGPLALSLPHVLLLSSIFLAVLVGWWVAKKAGRNPEAEIFTLLLVGVVLARAAFVVAYIEHFDEQLWRVIDIRDGGFILWPGLLAVALLGAWMAWRDRPLRRPLLSALIAGGVLWGSGHWVLAALTQGTSLPPMSLQNVDGQSIALHELDGKPLVLNVWATWCPPCRREMPVLEAAQRQYSEVTFVLVNQGESLQTIQAFLSAEGLQLDNVLLDSHGRFSQQVGANALPTTLFYNADGRQVGSHMGELSRASLAHTLKTLQVAK